MDNPHISPSPSPEASDRELLAEITAREPNRNWLAENCSVILSEGGALRAIARARSESASEIARLTAEVGALREALMGLLPSNLGDNRWISDNVTVPVDMTVGDIRKAHSAIRSPNADSNG